MEEVFLGVVAKTENSGDYDKLLKIITPFGVKSAVMRGVKKPAAKLKSCSMPLAFCEFSGIKKGGLYVITSASPIEDIYHILLDSDKFFAASIVLEAALNSFVDEDCGSLFVFMLRRLKDISGDSNPYTAAARFLLHVIFSMGFSYKFDPPPPIPTTVMELLAALNLLKPSEVAPAYSEELVKNALLRLIKNFEKKIECQLKSKTLLVF